MGGDWRKPQRQRCRECLSEGVVGRGRDDHPVRDGLQQHRDSETTGRGQRPCGDCVAASVGYDSATISFAQSYGGASDSGPPSALSKSRTPGDVALRGATVSVRIPTTAPASPSSTRLPRPRRA